jgi:PEP-CTERM motif
VLNSDTGYQTAIGYLDTYPSGAPGIWTYNAALSEFSYTDTFDVTGANGSFPILLDAQLICEYGVTCDYGDTLQTALSYPSNVTLTSDSGVFPTQTPTPAPEPGTLGLLAFGMAGVAVSRRWRLR